MKFAVTIFIAVALLWSQPSPGAKCKVVAGAFQRWNGWPPSLRLTDAKSGKVYGTYEHTPLPGAMRQEVIRNGRVSGKFCLKVVGRTTVPTQKEPIILVHVVSYSQ